MLTLGLAHFPEFKLKKTSQCKVAERDPRRWNEHVCAGYSYAYFAGESLEYKSAEDFGVPIHGAGITHIWKG